jgi:hypothetical protein
MSAATCTRHGGHCAYTGAELDRCPSCHRSWSVITGRDERQYAYQEHRAVRPPAVVRAEHERLHS